MGNKYSIKYRGEDVSPYGLSFYLNLFAPAKMQEVELDFKDSGKSITDYCIDCDLKFLQRADKKITLKFYRLEHKEFENIVKNCWNTQELKFEWNELDSFGPINFSTPSEFKTKNITFGGNLNFIDESQRYGHNEGIEFIIKLIHFVIIN